MAKTKRRHKSGFSKAGLHHLARRAHKLDVESPLVRTGRLCGCKEWMHDKKCKLGLGSNNKKRSGAVMYFSRRPKKVTKRKKRS